MTDYAKTFSNDTSVKPGEVALIFTPNGEARIATPAHDGIVTASAATSVVLALASLMALNDEVNPIMQAYILKASRWFDQFSMKGPGATEH